MCSYYRLLWSTSKKLDGKGIVYTSMVRVKIFGRYVSNESMKINLLENSWLICFSYGGFRKVFSLCRFSQFGNEYYCTVCKYRTGCFVELFLSSFFYLVFYNFFCGYQISLPFFSSRRFLNWLFLLDIWINRFLLFRKFHSEY